MKYIIIAVVLMLTVSCGGIQKHNTDSQTASITYHATYPPALIK